MVQHAWQEGFIYAEHLALYQAAEAPHDLLDQLIVYHPPQGLERWVKRDD